MNVEHHFRLSKWYLDCVTNDGSVFIGYSIHLRWGIPGIQAAQAFKYRDDLAGQTQTAWGRHRAPEMDRDTLVWTPQSLPVAGRWQGECQPVSATLLASDRGKVDWYCLIPHADARVRDKDAEELAGWGYVELLTLTVKPWELPIDELRWGRYLSERDSLIWIDWKGPEPRRWVFHQGAPVPCAFLNDDEVAIGEQGLRLHLTERKVIREGDVLPALRRVPWMTKILPSGLLNMHECKWRSRGSLVDNGTVRSTGWTIHEVVRWK